MQPLKGVLLDVDGTLVDSNDAHAYAWVRALTEYWIKAPFSRIRRLIGKGADKMLPEATGIDADSVLGKSIKRRRAEIFQQGFLPTLRPFRKAKALLARMSRTLRLAVASSAEEKELKGLLRVCGADEYIEARTSSDDADRSKPDPDIIQAALEQLGLPAAQVALLGDTPYDVEAGLKAGVTVVAVRCGGWQDADLSGATAIYDDPEDLLKRYEGSPFSNGPSKSPTRQSGKTAQPQPAVQG